MVADLRLKEVVKTALRVAGILDLRTLRTDQNIALGETIVGR
jgi:hypothetical protein